MNIADTIKENIKDILSEQEEVHLEHPTELNHGDYSTNVALILGKKLNKNPKEIAEGIISQLKEEKYIEKVEVAGPGFINFYLSRDFFTDSVKEIIEIENWGSNRNLEGKMIMVEYTDPNPFKPFHIGHLMSNAIGESISRLAEAAYANVYHVNYQGDIGLHVAKAIWAIQNQNFDVEKIEELGKAYVYGSLQYDENEEAKKEIIEINKKIYAEDKSVEDAYKKGKQTSLDHFEELYKVLGTKFDHYFFESETWKTGKELVEEGLKEGIFEESDGAIIFRGEKYGLHTRVFITKEGIPTYETKDLGLIIAKNEIYPHDTSIYVTGIEQLNYFDVVFKAATLLRPEFEGKLKHIGHGLMSGPGGKKISSRKGQTITGESFIEDVRKEVSKRNDNDLIINQISVAAIKYTILKQSSRKNIVFDLDQALSFEGNSGPYLQYSHTRAQSVLSKSDKEIGKIPNTVHELERLLYRFPEAVERASQDYEPHYVTTYLTDLAGAFNNFYANERIIDSEEEGYKLALTKAFQKTMQNGLWILGIETPERM